METLNRYIERLMPVLTPAGLVLAFFLPHVLIHLRPLVPWLFGLMTLSGALKLQVAEFGHTIRRPLPILLFFISTHLFMPLAALFVSSRFFVDADTLAGFVLLFSAPTAVSGFIWVSMFRGDKALCLTLILLDTLLAPLLVPGGISVLMGTRVAMDMTGITVSLLLMVVIPTIVGVTVNEASRGKIPARVCPYLNPVSKLCLLLVVAANASPVIPKIQFADPKVWIITALCVFLTSLGFVAAAFAARAARFRPETGVTLLFSGGLRNISAVSTIAVAFFPEAAALPALLGVVFQQSLSALMGKILVKRGEEERAE